MPYIIRPKSIRRLLVAGSAIGLLAGAMPAVASASGCPQGASSKVFSQQGDEGNYTLVSGGTFEAGAPGWLLNNAEVVSGEDPEGTSGHSLVIHAGGRAVSPSFCVSNEYPTFRFQARQLSHGGFWGSLGVALRWTDAVGFPHETNVTELQGNGSWSLSPVLELATKLPLWMPGSTLKVSLVFQSNNSAVWAIDNVYIDPYRR
jgi:hypothetical protein